MYTCGYSYYNKGRSTYFWSQFHPKVKEPIIIKNCITNVYILYPPNLKQFTVLFKMWYKEQFTYIIRIDYYHCNQYD